MKIYIASSWKNKREVIALAAILRKDGHKVDAFCEPFKGRHVFNYNDLLVHTSCPEGIERIDECTQLDIMQHPVIQRAFREDRKWLDWSDACVLLLPSGRSAHLEAGYAVGRGKRLIILGNWPIGEFDVMYGFAHALVSSADELIEQFKV